MTRTAATAAEAPRLRGSRRGLAAVSGGGQHRRTLDPEDRGFIDRCSWGSTAFPSGGWIPRLHTGEGEDLSPPLQWQGASADTVSLALILDDPDAPAGLWIHWVLLDLPATLNSLPEGLERSVELANGARHGSCWGVDQFSRRGYYGPQLPPGPVHHDRFQLSALDCRLGLPAGSTAAEVRQAMDGHVLRQAELIGLYQHGRSA